jgi:hypothetical protein
MGVPFGQFPHSAMMITSIRELRCYLFRCATRNPKTGRSRWSQEKMAIRLGLALDSVMKAERSLKRSGWLDSGHDKSSWWMPLDPAPMNLWEKSEASANFPESANLQDDARVMESRSAYVPAAESQPVGFSQPQDVRTSANLRNASTVADRFSALQEELVEESTKELTKELGEDAAPRSAQPSPALIESDDPFDFLSPREPEPERAPPPPSLRQRNGKCPGCDIRKPLWGYDGGEFLCRQCRHPSDIPKPAEPNSQARVDEANADFEAIKAQTF